MIAAYHEQVTSRQDVYRQARAMKLENAIVILQGAAARLRKRAGMNMKDLARNGAILDAPVLTPVGMLRPSSCTRPFRAGQSGCSRGMIRTGPAALSPRRRGNGRR